MAKRKHSTALFEVITKSRRYTKPQPAGLSPAAPNWWFKRRPKPDAAEHDAATADPVAQAPTSPPARAELAQVVEPKWPPEHELPPSVHAYDHEKPYAPGEESDDILSAPRAQSVAVSVDPDRRQIALRMSYTAAIIIAFSVLVLVGLSIIVGQHMSRNGSPLLAQTTSKALQESPAHREVMDVTRQTFATPNIAISNGGDNSPGRGAVNPPAGNPQPGPSAPVDMAKRYVGLNYVIAQGYAAREEEMASKAAAFLTSHGVACTVEKDVKGYSPVTVVGLQGFDRQTSPAIKSYMQKIEDLSAEYTKNSRGYKAFTPLIKKWDKTN